MENIDPFINTGESFSDMLLKKTPDQISVEVSEMTLTEHLALTSETFNKLGIDLKGEGMEIAAGAAVFASSLARIYPNISKIYALEIVPGMVTKLQPKIIEHTNMVGRVIPMVGDFNNIKMPNNSLDFVVGFNALHHSNTLHKTLVEIGRVLKPGGKLICFDRAQPNHMTHAQENFLLNIEYSKDYKLQHGLRQEDSYKRSDNGEHEPRLCQWNTSLAKASLNLDTVSVFLKRTPKRFLRTLIAHIPYTIRKHLRLAQGITSYNKYILYYLFPYLASFGKLKIFSMNTKFKTPTA